MNRLRRRRCWGRRPSRAAARPPRGDGEPSSPSAARFAHFPSPASLRSASSPASGRGKGKVLGRQRFFYGGDELFEREWFWQKSELPVLGQILLEGVFRIAGDEDDLQVRIAIA